MIQEKKITTFVSITEITSSIRCFLNRYKKSTEEVMIYEILSHLLQDFFYPIRDKGYLGETLDFFYALGLKHEIAYSEAEYMYNQLLFLMDNVRLSENLDCLDKTKYEILSLDRMLLVYDPKTPIINYTF